MSYEDTADVSPTEWARKMSDTELLERMVAYARDAALPKAVALEVKRRFNARKYSPRARGRP